MCCFYLRCPCFACAWAVAEMPVQRRRMLRMQGRLPCFIYRGRATRISAPPSAEGARRRFLRITDRINSSIV
ncbi:hypothetical protein BDW72DRAFT_171029 [Aspergillus terricola var. indicus]